MKITQLPSGFHVIEDDCIGKWQVETGQLAHDNFLVPFACQQIPEGGVVFDCGALCGDHAVKYSEKLGKKGTLIAIEPGKPQFDCLAFNAQAFVSKVICVPCAVSNNHGGIAYHRLNEDNVGGSMVDILKGDRGEEVRTVSIDGLMEDGKIKRLDFIKLDVEGWELKALQGGKESIEKHHPILLIEINAGRLKDHAHTPLEIYDFLAGIGYKWRMVQGNCKPEDPMFDILSWHESQKDPMMPWDLFPTP